MCLPLVARGHGLGHHRTGHGVGTVSHGDVTGRRDAVGMATVDDGGGLRAVGGVVGDGLGDGGGGGTGGQGRESSDRETHFECVEERFEECSLKNTWVVCVKSDF